MADEVNLLDGLDTPDLLAGSEPREPTPISAEQRLIIQNIFDSQPKRRKAYLEKLGWEMGPDGNKVRPIGDTTPWKDVQSKVDPEFSDLYKKGAFFKNFGDNLKKLATEAGQDVGDVIADFAEGAGSSALALNAGMVGSLGSPALGVMAAMGGGALGTASAEAIKQGIAETLLDKDVPVDMGLATVQALTSGVVGSLGDIPAVRKAIRGGTAGTANFIAERFKTARQNLKEAIKSAGGVHPEVLEKFAENPELFSKEASKGGMERLRATFRQYVGLDPDDFAPTRVPDRILPDSEFGRALAPLRAAESAELARLKTDPQAAITYGDYLDQFLPKMEELTGRGRLKPKEKQALSVFEEEIREMAKDAGISADKYAGTKNMGVKNLSEIIDELRSKPMDFEKFTRNLDILQDKAFQADPLTGYASKNGEVAQVAGRLRQLRDTIADQSFERRRQMGQPSGEPLSAIKAKQSEILDAYEKVGSGLTPDKVKSAFLGKNSNAQQEVIGTLQGLDGVLGTDFKNQLETGAFQSAVDSLFSPGAYAPKGSSRVINAALEGGLDKGLKAAVAGAGVGGAVGGLSGAAVGATVAGLAAGAKGARDAVRLSTPERALEAIKNNRGNEEALRSFAERLGLKGDAVFGPQATSALETAAESMATRGGLTSATEGLYDAAKAKEEEEPNLLEGL